MVLWTTRYVTYITSTIDCAGPIACVRMAPCCCRVVWSVLWADCLFLTLLLSCSTGLSLSRNVEPLAGSLPQPLLRCSTRYYPLVPSRPAASDPPVAFYTSYLRYRRAGRAWSIPIAVQIACCRSGPTSGTPGISSASNYCCVRAPWHPWFRKVAGCLLWHHSVYELMIL